jgi:hypothetical protein
MRRTRKQGSRVLFGGLNPYCVLRICAFVRRAEDPTGGGLLAHIYDQYISGVQIATNG